MISQFDIGGKAVKNLSERQRLNILLALGGFVLTLMILILIFGFKLETNKQKEKIGFIILGDINEAGWNASHYNGIKAACDEFDIELLVRDHVKENSGQCRATVEELASQGAGMIVLASFNYPAEVRDLMDKYSNISFVDTSTKEQAKNLTACFARMYQGRYISGALAGMKTKSNVIGYVAAMPNAEVCRGINAFTLGLHRTNPNAKVVVMWTGDWEIYDIEAKNARRLIEECNADILTYHQDDAAVPDVADSLGIDFIGYNTLLEGYSEHYLTSIICRWDLLYKDIVQRYLKGELSSIRNRWVGVQEGVIYLSDYSASVTPDMIDYLNSLKNELYYNELIFHDDIYDNQGNLRCSKGEAIIEEELLKNVDWLVRGVEVLE